MEEVYGQFQGVDVRTKYEVLNAFGQLMDYPKESDEWTVSDRWVTKSYATDLAALPTPADRLRQGLWMALGIVLLVGAALLASLGITSLMGRRFTLLKIGVGALFLDALMTLFRKHQVEESRIAMLKQGHDAIEAHVSLIETLVTKRPFEISFLRLLQTSGLVEAGTRKSTDKFGLL